MSEPVSALDRAAADGAARVADQGPQGMVTLRGDLGSDKLCDVAAGLAGVAFPEPMQANVVNGGGLCWMSPDEVLLLCPHAEAADRVARLSEALAGTHHLAADVSDARALIHVSGSRAREVLAKLTPADVAPQALPVGRFRRSRLAQVPAAFWMHGDETAAIICFRSVARYAFDILVVSAREGGEVGYF